MKRKSWLIGLTALSLFLSFSLGVFAAPKLSVWFNNKSQKVDIRIINNKPYLYLNDVATWFGGKVSYDKKTNTYKVTSKDFNPNPPTYKSYSVNIVNTTGPMKMVISKVTVDPSYKYNSYASPMKAVILDVTVSNTSSDKVSWYPTQGIYAFNTGVQVENAILYGNQVDGDFLGGSFKTGKIVLNVTNSNIDLIKSIQVNVDGPTNSNFDKLGDDLLFNFSFR